MEKKKEEKIYEIIAVIFITAIISSLISITIYYKYLEKKGALLHSYKENQEIQKSLDEVKTILSTQYKGEIDDKKLEEGALKGYVQGLGDKYTEYMTNEEWSDLEESLSSFSGIGVYLTQTKDTKQVIIIGFTGEDSPAKKAGLQYGDIIIEINGVLSEGKTVEEITKELRGKEGSEFKIKVKRNSQILEYTVKRQNIKMYEIKSKMINDEVGYIDFDSFTETSYEEFKNAFESLKAQGMKKIIIDLRDNGGGYVTSALEIADLIIPKGETLLIEEDKNQNKIYKRSSSDPIIDIPIAVLVNKSSASASEILTGILKDYKKATIIGETTYGKGIIQVIIPNVAGGVLKVTADEYYTPKGTKINGIGIEPDIKMSEESQEEGTLNDTWIKKAIENLN